MKSKIETEITVDHLRVNTNTQHSNRTKDTADSTIIILCRRIFILNLERLKEKKKTNTNEQDHWKTLCLLRSRNLSMRTFNKLEYRL